MKDKWGLGVKWSLNVKVSQLNCQNSTAIRQRQIVVSLHSTWKYGVRIIAQPTHSIKSWNGKPSCHQRWDKTLRQYLSFYDIWTPQNNTSVTRPTRYNLFIVPSLIVMIPAVGKQHSQDSCHHTQNCCEPKRRNSKCNGTHRFSITRSASIQDYFTSTFIL